MEFKQLIKKGLLGYQPIFFPNGVISGTGFQFFGNLRAMRASAGALKGAGETRITSSGFRANDQFNFNRGRLGNLYVPPDQGDTSEFNSEFYYCVDQDDLQHFARYNLILQ